MPLVFVEENFGQWKLKVQQNPTHKKTEYPEIEVPNNSIKSTHKNDNFWLNANSTDSNWQKQRKYEWLMPLCTPFHLFFSNNSYFRMDCNPLRFKLLRNYEHDKLSKSFD